MFRARWAALALGAGITLTSGCSLLHRPCMEGCCTGMCAPESEGYEEGVPLAEGALPEGYPGAEVAPGPELPALPPTTPAVPSAPLVPPVNPPAEVQPLVPQPGLPPLSSPPRLVPMPQTQPEAYRPVRR